MASVKVFGSPTSAEVARVLMCLFEKDVEFQLIRVDAYHGAKRMPQYLKLQPRGEALTFEDDSLTLSESRSILRHISHKYAKQGNPDLIGSGALERASIEQWLQTEAQSFDVPSAEMVYSLAFLPPTMPQQHQNGNGNGNGNDNGNGYSYGNSIGNGNAIGNGIGYGVVNASTKRVAAGAPLGTTKEKEEEMRRLFDKSQRDLEMLLDIYEQRLEEAAYLAGEKFTIADLSHLPNADRLANDPRSRRMFQRRRNISRWWNDVSRRESWAYVKSLQRPPSSNGAGADADAAHAQNGQKHDGDNDRNNKLQRNQHGDNDHPRNQYSEAKDYQQSRPSSDGRY